jgi:tRNA A-37 threonylcarbamoyl transferase component Bud32
MSDLPETFRDGRYAVVRVLGEGAQGTTFEAVDKKDGRLVAIKRFQVRGAKSWKEVELAEREARVLSSIDHPALPRYVEHFEERGELFLVTEKIEGENLLALRKRGVSFGERDVVRLLRDASTALDYLHGRAPPIVHRDLKPSNVLRRPDGSFAFIDFGAVRDRMKPEGGSTVVGTFGYMAPEQFQGRAMPASDVYAIGATALSMLTGVEPEDLPHRGLSIDVPAALRGGRSSAALGRLLAAMLEPDPDKRPAAIGPGLIELERGSRASPRAPSPQGPEQGRRDRPRDREEKRREKREARRERRDLAMMEWQRERERRGRQAVGRLPGLVMVVVMLGLTLAQVAVTVALRVAVPLAFTLLSLVFGKGMRRAGGSVSDAGKIAVDAIGRARDAVGGRRREERVRVATEAGSAAAPGVRIAADDAEAEREQQAEEEAEARRGRTGR